MKFKTISKSIKIWLLPFLISAVLFSAVRPVFAQFSGIQIGNSLIKGVGEEVKENGFRQIYYLDEGNNKIFITNSNYTNSNPVTDGRNVVWMAQIEEGWRIFLYNVLTSQTLQLTFSGINVNPKVDGGRVVWEGWDNDKWQIFFFDGAAVRKLTSGDLSLNPDISGEYISYGRKDLSGTWRAVVYSLKEDKSVDVALGEDARTPKIKNGDIYLGYGSPMEKKFPLSVADLFLLNLNSLTATNSAEIASTSAILNELTASPSAVVEIPLASQSAIPNPQSTSSGQLNLQ